MTGRSVQAGMTLIEVLVAVLILGVGLLGAAAVQLNALRYTDSALMTSQASFIAYDMLDRIRANSAADYTVAAPEAGNFGVVRDQDLYDFKRNVESFGGPTAEGHISLKQGVFTISITWDDARAAHSSGEPAEGSRSFVLSSRVAVDPGSKP
ncbi:type IV pilus modification protein PilV [Pseudomonas chlororaphis]|jgi:type IV pilus assembly protein PilV|uniref:Type IV pilus modification protein PilV n=1 Tax=Pseudomonas chlororaphis TaxID=587753 RepID=A0AB34BZE5_9PSED|nr:MULTISPECIES: type IV pilus modification protein PilV [Pseudomonas]AZD18112.1 Type IV fimbrial biogenesis protein PilV [Pseudomonas chlororaphis]KAA5837705.1 type IV pilus modification protein PilV [Pseudomonas chlororaphis]MCP1482674.1 type IV pilus assembly protein PilV [Pseudomonas chlororaphis]MCP1596968.1 type IV pilus assembly protein PilV [Pseudomonas chlororaphis]PXX73574.1 type IV pilus assembly protein PilV [Pseudomonas sp. LAMO17WK12:I9]